MTGASSAPRVLIVDDDATSIRIIAQALAPEWTTEFALSGPEVLSRLAGGEVPDLILLDVMMPEMDGYAVCEALKRDVRTQAVPVIFVTARNDAESETRALAAGGVDFIHKPINREVVRARVRLHLALTAQERELERLNAELEQRVQERTAALRDALIQAEAAHRAKNLFLANVNHELRTPMNAILGLAGLVARQVGEPRLRERMEKIVSAGRELLATVNNIIDMADLQAGRIQLDLIDFDLASVLDGVERFWRDRAAVKGLEIRREIDPALPPLLRGDAVRLGQILGNFLDNAIKFSKRGPIILRARLLEYGGDDLSVRFEVEDRGIGIPEERRAMIFDPFEQVDNSRTRSYRGSGLGLAICKQLAQLMDGQIGVVSTLNEGSSFWVILPLARATVTAVPAAGNDRGASEAIDWERARCLAVLLSGLLAEGDVQAWLVWFDNSALFDRLFGANAAAFKRAMEDLDFTRALELLGALRAIHPELNRVDSGAPETQSSGSVASS